MSSDKNKAEYFYTHGSEALRSITGAIEEYLETPSREISEGIQKSSNPNRHNSGRKPKKPEERSKNTVRTSVYMTPEQHRVFREIAFEQNKKISEFIINAAWEKARRIKRAAASAEQSAKKAPTVENAEEQQADSATGTDKD